MAIRSVDYLIAGGEISPRTLMWAGVQNEHNATVVRYKMDKSYLESLGENVYFRIDFSSDCAGYDPSENITLDGENCITREIPQKFTQYGGNMTVTLVITSVEDGEAVREILSAPSELFFTVLKRKDERIYTNLSAYEEYLLKLMTNIDESVRKAEAIASELDEKVKNIEINGVPVDLEQFVKKTDYADNTGNAGILRLKTNYGISSGRYDGTSPQTGDSAIIVTASNGEIKSRSDRFKPITSSNIDYAVKMALSDPKLSWTEEEKLKVRELLGVNTESTVIVDGYTANTRETSFTVSANGALQEGETYQWSYFASEYPGWMVDNEALLPEENRVTLTSKAEKVLVEGTYYVGFSATCLCWADNNFTNTVIIYQDGDALKVYRTFASSNDVIFVSKQVK